MHMLYSSASHSRTTPYIRCNCIYMTAAYDVQRISRRRAFLSVTASAAVDVVRTRTVDEKRVSAGFFPFVDSSPKYRATVEPGSLDGTPSYERPSDSDKVAATQKPEYHWLCMSEWAPRLQLVAYQAGHASQARLSKPTR